MSVECQRRGNPTPQQTYMYYKIVSLCDEEGSSSSILTDRKLASSTLATHLIACVAQRVTALSHTTIAHKHARSRRPGGAAVLALPTNNHVYCVHSD
jgi:hypothetical protein